MPLKMAARTVSYTHLDVYKRQPGSDADIVIWDPEYKGTITQKDQYQNVDYTPYEGVKTKGRAEVVLLNGEIIVEKGRVIAENKGQYIPRGICQL